MSKVPIKDMQGKDVGEHDVSDELLVYDKGAQAMHDAVVAHQARKRAGTASTKSKSYVQASGQKPWRQKGLGRARAGYRASPVWRGGAVAFGPHPRDFGKKMTRKAARLAFRRAVSDKVAAGRVMVLDALDIPEPKTRLFADLIKRLKLPGKAVFVVDRMTEPVTLAARNLPGIKLTASSELNTYDVLRYPVMVITRAGMAELEKRLKP